MKKITIDRRLTLWYLKFGSKIGVKPITTGKTPIVLYGELDSFCLRRSLLSVDSPPANL